MKTIVFIFTSHWYRAMNCSILILYEMLVDKKCYCYIVLALNRNKPIPGDWLWSDSGTVCVYVPIQGGGGVSGGTGF